MGRNPFSGFLEVYRWVVLDTNMLNVCSIGDREPNRSDMISYRSHLGSALLDSDKIVTSPDVRDEMNDAIPRLPNFYHRLFELTPIRVIYPDELDGRYDVFYEHLKPLAEEVGIVDHSKKFPYADVQLAAVAFSLCVPRKRVAFLSNDRNLSDLAYSVAQSMKNKVFDLPVEIGLFKPYRFSSKEVGTFSPHRVSMKRTHPLLLTQISSGNSSISS
jgi:hypothetical protein